MSSFREAYAIGWRRVIRSGATTPSMTTSPHVRLLPAPEPPAELLKQLAVFRFCEEELRRRAQHGTHAWMWRAKGKAARFCRRSLQRHLPDNYDAADAPLSPTEEDRLLRSHPLLLLSDAAASRSPSPDWLDALRKRACHWLSEMRRARDSMESD